MIDLTPLDVRKKRDDFRKAVRGYDASQVNAFLDLVAERLEELVSENRSLGERVAALEERLAQYRDRERALNEALLAAQELREEARSQAERDAAVKLREAETHAEAVLLEADQAIRHSQRRLREIQAQRARFLNALRGMIQRFTEGLELEEARLESEPDELEDLLRKLEREGGRGGGAPAERPASSRASGEGAGDRGAERATPGGATPEGAATERSAPDRAMPEGG